MLSHVHFAHAQQAPAGDHAVGELVLVTEVDHFLYAALDDHLRGVGRRRETERGQHGERGGRTVSILHVILVIALLFPRTCPSVDPDMPKPL
jgi:hypothetical protein